MTAKSTSGRLVCLGSHIWMAWSSIQNVVALRSAEAELYALVNGASKSLGLISMADGFGVILGGTVHTDSSAAIGITSRKALEKVRHILCNMGCCRILLKTRDLFCLSARH